MGKNKPKGIVSFVFVAVVAIAAAFLAKNNMLPGGSGQASSAASSAGRGKLTVSYLDVGQADSIFITLPDGKHMLIDAGNREDGPGLVKYLQQSGVKQLDYLVATHPHEDHIGGMANVIQNLSIGEVYMPKVADSQLPTTKVFSDTLDAISNKKLKIHQAKAGMTLLSGQDLKIETLAPVSDSYEDLNDYSVVIKLTYKRNRFLFMGDAGAAPENELLGAGADVKADVLKCGHHGSAYSTSKDFLAAVQPKYAVISCGLNNDYGHPHQQTLDRLKQSGAEIFRTDRQSTITAVSDGTAITMQTGGPKI